MEQSSDLEHVKLRHGRFIDHRRRKLLILGALLGLEKAHLTPASVSTVATTLFYANGFAETWKLDPVDAALLKSKDGIFYSYLFDDITHLVAVGLVEIKNPLNDKATSTAAFTLNHEFSDPVITEMKKFPEEAELLNFLEEVAIGFSRVPMGATDNLRLLDAAYGDPAVSFDSVIDLGELVKSEHAVISRVCDFIQSESKSLLRPSEQIEIYFDHLARIQSS